MNISGIMTKQPACATPDTKLEVVARMMAQKDCGAVPIVNDMQELRPVGIITDRDIICRTLANGQEPLGLPVMDFMTRTLKTMPETATIEDCCDLMEQSRIRRVLVVDHEGKLTGIVAQADIARSAPEVETAKLVHDVSMPAYATA